MLWLLCYIATVTFILYITLHVTWNLWTRKLAFIEFAPNVPWLGTLPYINFHPHQLYKQGLRYITKYDYLYVRWLGPLPAVILGRVEYHEPLMRNQENITKSSFYNVLQEWLGTGLLTSTGKKWKKRRAALTPAFHFNILNDYMEIYETNAKNLVRHFQSYADTSKAMDVQKLVNLATLDVICETAMGVQINSLDSGESEYVCLVAEIKTLMVQRILNPFLHSKSVYRHTSAGKEFYGHLNKLHNFTIDVINKKIESRKKESTVNYHAEDMGPPEILQKKRVFLDILLDLYDKGEIDICGIREEVDTFMFEGHDTTASGLCWILYEIGRHSEIQERIYEEIKTVSSKECSLVNKIRALKYVECVIKEAFRLHPPVPSFSRTLEKDLLVGENVIPSGTNVAVSPLSTHMNPAYWDNPSVFNPGRFESDEFLKRNPYCYIPFSAGPRNCIGQKFAMLEEKVFVYYILSNFDIKSIQSPDEIEPGLNLVMMSFNGIHIEFYSRQ